MKRRTFPIAIASLCLTGPLAAQAADDHSRDGPFSKLQSPQPVQDPGRVEVIEFFWYGCPHCAGVEPLVQAWNKSLPKDVAFRREHVVWSARRETEVHARLFATLRAMNLLDAHHGAVFEAIHVAKAGLRDEGSIFEWAARRGIDRSRFEAMFKSFSLQTQLTRARNMTESYRVEGVPTFVVNGRFRTEPHQAGGDRETFVVLDRLIAQERSALPR